MKKVLVLAAILALAGARVALGGMANTAHDLSKTSTATIHSSDATATEICKFCHIPHNGSPALRRPLWNHTLTTTNLSWDPTTTARATALPTDITAAALNGSRACLSCHDGTIALGDVIEGPASPGYTFADLAGEVLGGKLIEPHTKLVDSGGKFTKNHPIGLQKPADKAGFTSFKASPTGAAVDYDSAGYVQCQSCHNPHLTTYSPFLRMDNAGSAICTTCHDL